MPEYTLGFWSLLPALVAVGLALVTRQVLLALFAGVVTASVVLFADTGDWNHLNPVTTFFYRAVGSPGYAKILIVYLWSLGGLLGIWRVTGAAAHFTRAIGRRIPDRPGAAALYAWFVGCVFHQGGTVSTVLTGSTVKPVADRNRVSHEELSYIVDSTASPIATLLPFNVWPSTVAKAAAGTIPLLPTSEAAVSYFFRAIPFNFYSILAVLFTLLLALGWPVFCSRRMKDAIARARSTGQLDRSGAEPMMPPSIAEETLPSGYRPSLWEFLLPLGVLLTVAIVPLVRFDRDSVAEAFLLALVTAFIVARVRGMGIGRLMRGFLSGCEAMTVGALILALAVTLGDVSKILGAGKYVVQFADHIPKEALPAMLTGICMAIAFSTGSSFGTYAVVFPLAMPLAFAAGNEDPTYVTICFGAVLGGAVFGDQCSPISDTTILASMFTGCDLMDHVTTQIVPALWAAGIGAALSTLSVVVFV